MKPHTIEYLKKPNIIPKNLEYIKNEKDIYVNLFEIILKKPLKLYQYPYTVAPEIDPTDLIIRSKLFKCCYQGDKKDKKKLKYYYGEECFISGDKLYSLKEVKENLIFECNLYDKGDGLKKFKVIIEPRSNDMREINQMDINKDPLTKQFIELIIRNILRGNPDLEFYRDLIVLKNQKKIISCKSGSINFYPGYTTSFMETEGGNYLNVTLKNKILSEDTVLTVINKMIQEGKTREEIKAELIGRSFKVKYAKRNYIINDILFDRNPRTQTFAYEQKTLTLKEYYKNKYDIDIKNLEQPLIIVVKKDEEGKDINLFFVPELCNLAGLDDKFIKDRDFMKQLADYTKFSPKDRIQKTNEFLNLLSEPKRKDNELSAKERCELYGIEVRPLSKNHKAYYMKETELIDASKKVIKDPSKGFQVLKSSDLSKWLCLYRKANYDNAENLYNNLLKAAPRYDLQIEEPTWVEMGDKDKAKIWLKEVENKLSGHKFVVFLLDKNDYIYKDIKIHSLCTNGYVSQVVKVNSLKKNALSVCSKILLQINSKLSGVSYKPKLSKEVKDRKLMIIGVDSSHIKGKRTGVAMVATVNTIFVNFYNKEMIIEEKNKTQLQFCISGFITEAIKEYEKLNKDLPKGIIIYRQGVSLQQKDYLTDEVRNIEEVCNKDNLKYYYILVNTKVTYKFFQPNNQGYTNPEEGLLVLNGVTNRQFFEFYIQPQKVTSGSATPSCFHVAYGNLDFPEMIPKLTFDLCHLYNNWQGIVRVPHVLKAAEKLSKMTAKYTCQQLNDKLKLGQSYL